MLRQAFQHAMLLTHHATMPTHMQDLLPLGPGRHSDFTAHGAGGAHAETVDGRGFEGILGLREEGGDEEDQVVSSGSGEVACIEQTDREM